MFSFSFVVIVSSVQQHSQELAYATTVYVPLYNSSVSCPSSQRLLTIHQIFVIILSNMCKSNFENLSTPAQTILHTSQVENFEFKEKAFFEEEIGAAERVWGSPGGKFSLTSKDRPANCKDHILSCCALYQDFLPMSKPTCRTRDIGHLGPPIVSSEPVHWLRSHKEPVSARLAGDPWFPPR